ncbi:MAG: AEC family transporter [Amphiplicatus sp.]
MTSILDVIFPVFFLIAAGYAAAKTSLFDEGGRKGLNDFTLYFCLPSLLFRTMQAVDLGVAEPWGIWGAYFLAAIAIWLSVALAFRRVPGLGDAGGAGTAFASTFGNVGMMGLSIAYLRFGEEGVVAGAMIVAIHASTHWLAGTLWAEWAQRGRNVAVLPMVGGVLVSLAKNPIVLSLALGAAWNAAGLRMPAGAENVIGLLGDAAVPVGLFALGMAVAAYPIRGALPGVATILALKMIALPLAAWALSAYVFSLPPLQAAVVTLFAALPTGVNPYLFSSRFNASTPAVSGAIALGVMVSIVTIPLVLFLVAPAS